MNIQSSEATSRRLLVDTQAILWYMANSPRLLQHARNLLVSETSELYFSVESIREIAIKYALGRPDFNYKPQTVYEALLTLRWKEVQTRAEHVFALEEFSHVHRDPFDRLLLAQAHVEDLTLLTADGRLLHHARVAISAG